MSAGQHELLQQLLQVVLDGKGLPTIKSNQDSDDDSDDIPQL